MRDSFAPRIFFFMCGIYSLYTWNSLMNLNGYFAEVFADPSIPKKYTFWYMFTAFCLLSLNFYICKHYDVYKVSMVSFIVIYALFHLNYLFTQYIPNGTFKTVVFLISCGITGFATSVYASITAGLSLRFGEREFVYRNIGISFGSLITNFLAFIGVFFTRKFPIRYSYLLYMFIGDLGIFAFLFFKIKFYKDCKSNIYVKAIKPKEISIELELKISGDEEFGSGKGNFITNRQCSRFIFN